MFEEDIAHGEDILHRLRKERDLGEEGVDALPASQRVSVVEADKWRDRVRQKLASIGADAVARLEIISAIRDDEISKRQGTELSRWINHYERVVGYLSELDARSRTKA